MFSRLAAFAVLFLAFQHSVFSQFGVGQWRDHLPYSNTIDVCDGGDRIYCATPSAVFYFTLGDNSVERLSKVNKLSDSGVSAINFDKATSTLIVGYSNGNLDLIVNDVAINLSDIKRSTILADKTIREIYLRGDYAYIACGFGVVVIDLVKWEVSDTYMLGPLGEPITVYDFVDDGLNFLAATESGIYTAPINDPFLANFQHWTKWDDLPNNDGNITNIEINDQHIIVVEGNVVDEVDAVYYRDAAMVDDWQVFPHFAGENVRALSMTDEVVLICSYGVFKVLDMDFQTTAVWGNIGGITLRGNALLRAENGSTWVANDENGLVGYDKYGTSHHAQPDGPAFLGLRKIDAYNENFWVASGGSDAAWTSLWKAYGIYGFVDEKWTNIGKVNDQAIFDYMDVSINPTNPNEVFLGSWYNGLVRVVNGEIVDIFDHTNSSLSQTNFGSVDRVAVGGVDVDPQGNVWFTNTITNTPLHVRTAGGEFAAFNFTPDVNENMMVTDVMATQQGYIYMLLPGGDGILVLDHKGTLIDQSDDEYKVLDNTEGNGGLPVEWVNCFEEDLDGEIWVGTLQGVAIFYTPEAIFNSDNFDAQQILIEQDGNIQVLLETENVTAITIDGANRKWIGTQHSGVYLMSADGTSQIYHFETDNSPLLSNNILDIAINHKSGEVFFATERGIVSFRSDATNFYEEMDAINVFPNPVRPDYQGVITIDGLSRDADVKIADVAGNVVYQTTANGGRATWDGQDFNGSRVSTGIYMVYITTTDGKSSAVSKVAFVN
jgi:hypothetical protein